MKHGYFGRKLGRNVGERRQLFMVLLRSLTTYGKIKTTLAKAKTIQPQMDKLITKAKSGKSADVIEVRKSLANEQLVKALLEMAKTRFSARNSGYTRIIKLGKRHGDAAEEVLIEFVDAAPVVAEVVKAPKKTIEKSVVKEAAVVEKPVKKERKKRVEAKK